ncbi:MAG: tRNA (adenosine(37)-N6)-threonylcarbamoyltransferase complex ATPase subunit type 1 TsaE [Ignavibacteriae bacterium]|nr:MAG: tRNA (adenosine(37)-N6)-threonylcarbamoyltransferase complex ATPase subunit type 1 TsaE [Ignavibacteriota bacterium]
MELPLKKNILNLNEIEEIAYALSKKFSEGDVVILNGTLGSGKTTLIKLICKNYSIFEVNSPSFSLVNEYNGEKKVYHFDFYRLEKIEELYDIGFEDYLNDNQAIIFIEWGNLMEQILPKNRYEINIELLDEEKRILKIHSLNK